MKHNLCRILAWISCVLAILLWTPVACLADPTGELQLSVVIVDELTPKPVPLTDFKITADFGDHGTHTARTDEHGTIDLKLPPGNYIIESLHPVNYKNHAYQWKASATIEADKILQLKLTDSDAVQTAVTPARQVSDEAAIYQVCMTLGPLDSSMGVQRPPFAK